jgi:hypothetical protein
MSRLQDIKKQVDKLFYDSEHRQKNTLAMPQIPPCNHHQEVDKKALPPGKIPEW